MLDWFAIFNILILLIALSLTVSIHVLGQKGRSSLAQTADKAGRPTIYLLYAIGLLGFVLYSGSNGDIGATVAYGITTCAALIGGMVTYVTISTRRRHVRMEELAKQILKDDFAEMDEAARHAMLQKLFVTFDSDRSGTLDEKEAAVLVRVLYRKLQKKTMARSSTAGRITTTAAAMATIGPLQLRRWTKNPRWML